MCRPRRGFNIASVIPINLSVQQIILIVFCLWRHIVMVMTIQRYRIIMFSMEIIMLIL